MPKLKAISDRYDTSNDRTNKAIQGINVTTGRAKMFQDGQNNSKIPNRKDNNSAAPRLPAERP